MSTNLSAGAEVILDTNGRKTIHVITARRFNAASRSGIQYRVIPSADSEWIDSDRMSKAKGFGSGANRKVDPFEISPREITP